VPLQQGLYAPLARSSHLIRPPVLVRGRAWLVDSLGTMARRRRPKPRGETEPTPFETEDLELDLEDGSEVRPQGPFGMGEGLSRIAGLDCRCSRSDGCARRYVCGVALD
jgi:hypothetical protein